MLRSGCTMPTTRDRSAFTTIAASATANRNTTASAGVMSWIQLVGSRAYSRYAASVGRHTRFRCSGRRSPFTPYSPAGRVFASHSSNTNIDFAVSTNTSP